MKCLHCHLLKQQQSNEYIQYPRNGIKQYVRNWYAGNDSIYVEWRTIDKKHPAVQMTAHKHFDKSESLDDLYPCVVQHQVACSLLQLGAIEVVS